jgi:hypothetical protein
MTMSIDHKIYNAGFRPELFAVKVEKESDDDGLPPVHLWNPDFCGNIDIRIRRDGSWDYMGTPITRERMVKLFSTILRRDGDDYFLFTPFEKVGIKVDDAPFVAVEMELKDDHIYLRTNVDDYVKVDKEHPIHVTFNKESGEPSPYVRVRDRLDALLNRSVYYQLAALAIERDGKYGIMSGNDFFVIGTVE